MCDVAAALHIDAHVARMLDEQTSLQNLRVVLEGVLDGWPDGWPDGNRELYFKLLEFFNHGA